MLLHLDFLRTYPFLIPLLVTLFAEAVKIIMEGIETGNWKGGLFRPGGMPSSHSALVTSLLIVVGHKLGIESIEFAIAVVFASIVWYDAMSSRRAIGEQAKMLNRLQKWQKLTERLGHSFVEVMGGIIFGGIVTWLGILVS